MTVVHCCTGPRRRGFFVVTDREGFIVVTRYQLLATRLMARLPNHGELLAIHDQRACTQR